MTSIINPSYYAMFINNKRATVSPIQSHNVTRLIFVYKSDVIGVEVYCFDQTEWKPYLFTILPRGVVSKNSIGSFSMFANIPL